MFKTRNDEPDYALLGSKTARSRNVYGDNIETISDGDDLRGKSLLINGESEISENANRYKQHGFYFTADNCIGCHACEAACSEKNDNPSHIAFRSVGFVESGTYPDYARINISMACNHCDDPVCLKGCPTRAYTKFAEYGAVLQDPDICFGCGYCTWVCPYNAPQLDPVKGQVSKCNMCVDRLEVGLKPACVSACLGNALDFGVIENTPERRDQNKTQIPGFPTPDITHPNIRFSLSRSLQRVFTRPDSAPVKYVREGDQFKAQVDEAKSSHERQWNLKPLLTSHENAHIIFTLCTQAVMGAFFINGPVPVEQDMFLPLMALQLMILSVGLAVLNLHLGKPLRFYRGFNNWKLSPVSREIAGVSLFFAGLGAYAFAGLLGPRYFNLLDLETTKILAKMCTAPLIAGGVVGLYYMIKLYLIPARPFWNHWQTISSFVGTTLSLGAVLFTVTGYVTYGLGKETVEVLQILATFALAGLLLEATGLIAHARDMKRRGGEGAASHFEQVTRYGYPYLVRNILLAINILVIAAIAGFGLEELVALPGAEKLSIEKFQELYPNTLVVTGGMFVTLSILVSAILGRALFYVLVIPTTMPGAFFWRNKGFEQHAQNSNIAGHIAAGIVSDKH